MAATDCPKQARPSPACRFCRDGVDSADLAVYSTIVPGNGAQLLHARLVAGESYTQAVQDVTSACAGLAASGTVLVVVDPPANFKLTQTWAATATMKWQPPAVLARVAYSSIVAANVRSYSMTRLAPRQSYAGSPGNDRSRNRTGLVRQPSCEPVSSVSMAIDGRARASDIATHWLCSSAVP